MVLLPYDGAALLPSAMLDAMLLDPLHQLALGYGSYVQDFVHALGYGQGLSLAHALGYEPIQLCKVPMISPSQPS